MRIRVGHLYPEYLNIYADRGNIAVLARRAALRDHELDVTEISVGDDVRPGELDLLIELVEGGPHPVSGQAAAERKQPAHQLVCLLADVLPLCGLCQDGGHASTALRQ